MKASSSAFTCSSRDFERYGLDNLVLKDVSV